MSTPVVLEADSAVMTLARMQKRLQLKGDSRGRVLLRILLAKERSIGRAIMVRTGGGKRTHYRISMSAIRLYARELLPSKVDELRRDFDTYLQDIDERIRAGASEYVAEYAEPRLVELWERDETLAGQIEQLRARVMALATNEPRGTRRNG